MRSPLKNTKHCNVYETFSASSEEKFISASWSPNGELLAIIYESGKINVFEMYPYPLEFPSCTFEHKNAFEVCWNHDSSLLASMGENQIIFWDIKTGKETGGGILPHKNEKIVAFDWAKVPNGALAYATQKRAIYLIYEYDVHHKDSYEKSLQKAIGHVFDIVHLKFSNDGAKIASGTQRGSVGVWSGNECDNQLRIHFEDHKEAITSMAWHPSLPYVATSSKDSNIVIRDAATNRMVATIENVNRSITGITFDPRGNFIVAKCLDHTIRIWRLDTLKEVRRIHEQSVASESHINGNSRFNWISSIISKETELSVWEINYDAILSEDKWSFHPYYSAKVLVRCFNPIDQDSFHDCITSGSEILSEDDSIYSLGKEERNVKNVNSVCEPILWCSHSLGENNEYDIVRNDNASMHLFIVNYSDLKISKSYDEINSFIKKLNYPNSSERNVACIPICLLINSNRNVTPEFKKNIEIDICKKTSFIEFVWMDIHSSDALDTFKDEIFSKIDWGHQPNVKTLSLLREESRFFEEQINSQYICSYTSEYYKKFNDQHYLSTRKILPLDEFEAGLKCLNYLGKITRFPKGSASAGESICLDMPIFKAYLKALFIAASEDDLGIGRLSDEKCYGKYLTVPDRLRLKNPIQESCLCLSILSILEYRSLIYKVYTGEGVFWIFPSETQRKCHPGYSNPIQGNVFKMSGPVEDAYSYIVTKLAGSSIFCDPVLWENHASFTCLGGDKCGLALTSGEDGTGFISLVFDNASEFTIQSFTEYVRKQLISIEFISKLDEKKLLSTNGSVRKINVRTSDCDTSHVFICYNSLDRESVSHITRELETRNLNVWYDKRMTAGDTVVDTLNEKIRSSSVILVLLGTHGFGKWQAHEVNQIIQVAIENGVRIIPGLLPNFKESDLPLVLKSYNYVSFSDLSYNAFDKIAEATRIGVRSEYEEEQEI